MASRTKTHIPVIPFPFQGHINPLVQFVKQLADKGPKVTLVTTTSMLSKSMEARTRSINIELISDGFSEGEKIKDFDEYLGRFKLGVDQSFGRSHRKTKSL